MLPAAADTPRARMRGRGRLGGVRNATRIYAEAGRKEAANSSATLAAAATSLALSPLLYAADACVLLE